MKRDEALTILSGQKLVLRERFGVKSIAIFGSTARNQAGPDSDVDVLVEFEKPVGYFTLSRVRFHLEDHLGRPVDIATPGAIRPSMRVPIDREQVQVAFELS